MGLTSRRKRPLNHDIPHYRDTRIIVIASEGEKTEKQYFESELFGNSRVHVRVIETICGLSAPSHVLERLKNCAKEYHWEAGDQFWVVVDKDRWADKMLSKVSSYCLGRKKQKMQFALSNPCFELWLYLHRDEWTAGKINSRDMKENLRTKLGSYNESNLNTDDFKGRVDKAITRAEKLDTNPSMRWPNNPGTHVHRLVKEIRNLAGHGVTPMI